MQQQPKPADANLAATDEQVLDDNDVKRLAALLSVLMEVEFYLKRKPEGVTND